MSPLATSGYNQSLIAGIVLIGWICALLVARRQNSSGVLESKVPEVSQGAVVLFTLYSRVGMLKPNPRGRRCNPAFLSYRVDNLESLSPQLKMFSAWGGYKAGLIAAPAHWVSTALLYSNNYRGGCPDLIALAGHLWEKVMVCVLALAVAFPLWKTTSPRSWST